MNKWYEHFKSNNAIDRLITDFMIITQRNTKTTLSTTLAHFRLRLGYNPQIPKSVYIVSLCCNLCGKTLKKKTHVGTMADREMWEKGLHFSEVEVNELCDRDSETWVIFCFLFIMSFYSSHVMLVLLSPGVKIKHVWQGNINFCFPCTNSHPHRFKRCTPWNLFELFLPEVTYISGSPCH